MQTLQGNGFIVKVIKSNRRKTMALKVDTKGVSIHIPANLPLSTANTFIQQKNNWIHKKLALQKKRSGQQRLFIDGEIFLFLGKEYRLNLTNSADRKTIIERTKSTLELFGQKTQLSKAAIHATLVDWYKAQATSYLIARTQWLSEVSNLYPASVAVKSYKARWGSCSAKGDLKYNWQLIQAPGSVIDYVIFHELSHLTHHNHSPAFWQLVEKFCPDFKKQRLWLKTNGHMLSF